MVDTFFDARFFGMLLDERTIGEIEIITKRSLFLDSEKLIICRLVKKSVFTKVLLELLPG